MKVVCLLVNIKLDFQLNNSSLTSPKAGESLFSARTGHTPQNAEALPQTRSRHSVGAYRWQLSMTKRNSKTLKLVPASGNRLSPVDS